MTVNVPTAWESMYAEHKALAKHIHNLAGDEDPHVFGRRTASCDWMADGFGRERDVPASPALRDALLEIIASLVPNYDPDHPEDHGFSATTGAIIRAAMNS